jgi:hypothetical protein
MRNLMLLAIVAGCTRPGVAGTTYLDGSVKVTAEGTRPRSLITLSRGGALDPASSAMEVMINNADVALEVRDNRARLDRINLTLDTVTLPPSQDLPHGLELRDNSLQLDQPLVAKIEEAQPDQLTLSAHGTLSVHSKMVLSDGSLYPLGPVESAPGDLTVRVTRDGDRYTVTLDAAPPATCWSLGTPDQTLLQANNCSVFVESFATVESL